MAQSIANNTLRFRNVDRDRYRALGCTNNNSELNGFGFAFIPFIVAAASATAAIGGAVLTLKQLSGANPKTVDKIVKSVTPKVVAALATKGIILPAGQEEQYVKSALISAADQQNAPLSPAITQQLQSTSSSSMLIPLGIGALALILLIK